MKSKFKQHILNTSRYQTSSNRDLCNGLRLDRNERVMNEKADILGDVWSSLPPYILHATPNIEPLYQKIISEHDIERDQLYIAQGITECIRFLYEALTKPGDNVVVLDPTYPMYSVYSELFQLKYRGFKYGDDYKPDWQSLYENVDENTAIVAVANPNLPIESAFNKEEIIKLAKYCKEREIILAVDEAYHGFGSYSAIELINKYDNLVILRTFSKAWGLAAIRLGYAISQSQNIDYLSKTRSLVETNALSMEVAMYALTHRNFIDDHVREVKEGAEYLKKEFDKLNIKYHGGDYTNGIMIFLHNSKEAKSLYQFLQDNKIYIRGSFEKPYHSCVRVSIGAVDIMTIFLDYFKKWLEEIRPNL